MNNSTKPLSESELAKQKVMKINPRWISGESGLIYEPLFSDDGVRIKWRQVAESWIDAASKLPRPLLEDGVGGEAKSRSNEGMRTRTEARRIIRGDRVRLKEGNKRLGTVGYAAYSIGLACVTWDGRKTHDIVRKEHLVRVKKEAGDD